jgi:TetR/AcrR family transcriptional repressor of nem operon
MTTAEPAPSTATGRPRGFAPEAALASALDVFWRQGYAATSLDDLTEAMGLSRSSFYACFGSKHELLMKAVEAYADAQFDTLRAVAARFSDPLAAARALLGALADAEGGVRGCFFANTISELAPHDEPLAVFARAHISRLAGLVSDMLVDGGFPRDLAQPRAAALLACAVGATALRKAGIAPSAIAALMAETDHLLTPPRKD